RSKTKKLSCCFRYELFCLQESDFEEATKKFLGGLAMNIRKVSVITILFTLFCVAILSSCSKANEKETTIRIGEVTRSLFYAPQYVAIEKGFFKEEGINIELTTTPGGDKTMTALLSNVIDVALVGSETS